jgi:transcriptional regulator with XRE-family HTH domain
MKNLDKYMKKRGILQVDLAAKAGVTQSYISQLKNGQRDGSVKLTCKIAEILQCKLTDIIDDRHQSAQVA